MENFDTHYIPKNLYGFAFAGLPARILYRRVLPQLTL